MKTSSILRPAIVRWGGLLSVMAFMAIGLIGLSAVTGGEADAAPSTFEVPATTRSFADVVEMVSPSVVAISVTRQAEALPMSSFSRRSPGGQVTPFDEFFGHFFGAPGMTPRTGRTTQALGSGFLIDESGYIVTNNHVIENSDTISVLLQDGSELHASLVGTDPKTDLALLKVESKKALPALNFGDSDHARVGDWVLAIGNPFGLGGSATAGIISARGRDIRSGPYDDYLQIDAPINSGNSGGPVFNADGEVIGVNTAIYSPNGGNVGIGFAIPSKQVQTIVAELKSTGAVRRGWLGVQIQDVDEELASSLGLDDADGALVADVVDDSPASDAGLRVGDVITHFGDNEISSAKSLSMVVADTDPSNKVPVKIIRDGSRKTLHVKLGEADESVAGIDGMHVQPGITGSELGLGLSELSDSQRQQLGLPEDYSGVLVSKVQPGSSADEQGLEPGDVISRVGSTKVRSVSEAKTAINKAKTVSDHAALLVRRGDSQQYVSIAFS